MITLAQLIFGNMNRVTEKDSLSLWTLHVPGKCTALCVNDFTLNE